MSTYLWNNSKVIAEPLGDGRYKITDTLTDAVCHTDTLDHALIIGNLMALGQIQFEK